MSDESRFIVPRLTCAIGFMNETGLVLYVYPPSEDESEESCLTVVIPTSFDSHHLTRSLPVLHQFIQRLSQRVRRTPHLFHAPTSGSRGRDGDGETSIILRKSERV